MDLRGGIRAVATTLPELLAMPLAGKVDTCAGTHALLLPPGALPRAIPDATRPITA